jgi:ABC-2 type transport system ATP-binding protein
MQESPVIVAKNLSVVRGGVAALNKINFSITPGKITGLIGPSGSGKTTLMRAIIGAQILAGGSLEVMSLPAGSKRLRSQIGYVTQNPAVYDDLTVKQNLTYFAAILGLDKREVERSISAVDLKHQANQIAGSLSGGQKARASLAVALLGEPQLLVLDEPTVGLDPILRENLWSLFANLAEQGRTLLISSHVMDEAEQCQDLLLLRNGKVLNHSTKQELLKSTKTANVHDAFLKLAGGEK